MGEFVTFVASLLHDDRIRLLLVDRYSRNKRNRFTLRDFRNSVPVREH